MAETKPLLNGPVPGQSLTAELGARPWQQPAKYTNVEDALEFYVIAYYNGTHCLYW